MRLSVIVSLFDGEELLEGAIAQIRDHCEEIILVWQSISNSGEHREIESFVKTLLFNKTINTAIEYTANLSISPRDNELLKRQLGVRSVSRDITHFLFFDTDEYYDTAQFAKAKEIIMKSKYDSSFCRIYTYYKEPIYRLEPIEDLFVPFIHKLSKRTAIGFKNCPYPADMTRTASPMKKVKIFEREELIMHHFSFVRKDISLKLRNSSALQDYPEDVFTLSHKFSQFDPNDKWGIILKKGHYIVESPNLFGISL